MSTFRDELRQLIRLAIPLATAQAGHQLLGVVDTAVVGRLGAVPLAAIGVANAVFFTVSIIGMGIVMGIDPMAAQAFGAGDAVRARRIFWNGVWLACATGGVLSIPLLFSPPFLHAIGIEPAVAGAAGSYLLIRTISIVPMLLYFVVRAYLQARMVTRPIVLSMVVGNVLNLGADIVLVYGGGVLPLWTGPLRSIPAMGLDGAAIATVGGTVVQLAIVAWGLRSSEREPARGLRRFVRSDFITALRLGMPLGLQMAAEVGIFALVGLLAARLGAEQAAAHQIALTLAALTFTVALGVGSAGSVRVGRAIGARDRERTRAAGLAAFVAGAGFMTLAALAFTLFPRQLASLITGNAEAIAAAVPLLAVAALFQISDGIQGVGAGVLRGAGDTRFAFFANVIGHWLVGLPVALLVAMRFDQGVVGLWWGLSAGLTVVAAMLLTRFLIRSARGIEPITQHASR
jgi:multidrug resistance protein, MATE family